MRFSRLPGAAGPRRIVASAALLVVTSLAGYPASTFAQELPPDPDSARSLRMNVEDGFTVGAVGDLILARPISQNTDSRFTRMVDILRRPDVTFGNLEGSIIDIRDFEGHPRAGPGIARLVGVPRVAEDLKELGFDMLARANNHTTDWGVEGMRTTSEYLDAEGLVHAGAGEDLAGARAGRYFETPKGRVALVSIASSFAPSSRAGNPMGEAPGRPGVSALRTTRYSLVTEEELEVLRQIREAQPETPFGDGGGEGSQKELELSGVNYRIGTGHGFEYEMNQDDLEGFLRSIRAAKRNADFVIATIHAHQTDNRAEPPQFLVELAHKAIEAGADEFVGHGPHQLRGIEIYKGKPIFYSLADLVFQLELQYPIPRDLYEMFDVEYREVTNPEFTRRLYGVGLDSTVWFESVIAESRFKGGKVAEIRLHPVEQGYEKQGAHRGVPRLARPGKATDILERLQRLSEPYGTSIEIVNGVGIIRSGQSESER